MLDLKEEQQYREFKKLAQELHVPIPEAFLELEVFDKNGKLIQRHRQRSHSWTRNAYNLMFCELAGKDASDVGLFEGGKLSIKATSGTILAGDTVPYIVSGAGVSADLLNGYRAGAGIDTSGILVGSGSDAESFEDYKLQTQIANGTGAGQLSYQQSEAHSISYAALTLKNTLIRYFNNNSGAPVDVNEVALVTTGYHTSGQKFLMTRDKLASTVTVPDTGQLKVTYTIQLTYPA